jgi:DNA-binding transcriptional regulator YiaG
MPSIASVLKAEITRLARKEIKAELAATKKASTRHRREIAELKRQLKDQTKKVAALERATATAAAKPAEPEVDAGSVRFSPKWVRTHREKIAVSQADYAALVGVSTLTIYNWESGRTRPAAKQLAAWGVVRAMGKREAWRRLEEME